MRSLSRYEILERIAVGGMAEVFRARAVGAHGFEKLLAIKRILPGLAHHVEFERRFIAEAKIAVTLAHANIVQVMDFGRAGQSLYIAMELVDGPNLATLLRWHAQRGATLPVGASLYMCMEILKGLEFAHQRGIVHRDVSPSNILLSRAGEVKIADFGIAKVTDVSGVTSTTRRVMGKWPYMSPEQARGEELDGRSDLFSTAVIAWELLSGRRLFHGPDVETMVRNVCEGEVPPLSSVRSDLPAGIDPVLARALDRDREQRYPRAAEMLRALLEVCFEHKLVASGLELPDLVRMAFPDEAVSAPHAPTRWAESTVPPRTRVTETAAPPPLEGGSLGHVTLIPRDVGADGVTVWEVKEGGAETKPPGGRRWRRPAGVAAGVLVLATVGLVVGMVARGGRPAVVPGPDAAKTAAAAAPGAVPDAAAVVEAVVPVADAVPAPAPAASVPAAAPQRWGTVDLHTEPWAQVWLGGRKLGDAPIKGLRLPYGRHKLRLVNPVRHVSKTLIVEVPGRHHYAVDLEE